MDIFGTERMRAAVLAAWTASPARFREDANAEEDFALGGYRDRLIVELAQNAADAALRAGAPGALRLSLDGDVLTAANTGAPLDAAGVVGLSTLRVSAKQESGYAGRFGVGFAAVVSVSDEPSIGSREVGAVRWSRAETVARVESVLPDELAARSGHVPLLRLPFEADPLDVPDGFDTLVRLPLRDAAAVDAVRRMLDETSPALLLGLPSLSSIEIVVDGVARSVEPGAWHVVSESGEFSAAEIASLFADRPTEERARPFWSLRWAVRLSADGGPLALPSSVPAVVHAPTPSDEPLDLPALLIASFPLATDRRHVANGPLTDFLVARVADAYVRLLQELPRTPKVLDLVPALMGKGELDARIRRAILRRLPDVPLLPALSAPAPAVQTPSFADSELYDPDAAWTVEHPVREPSDDGWVVSGREAGVVSGTAELLAVIADFVPGLLPAGWPSRHPAMSALGVRRVELADVVDLLSGEVVEGREASWWRSLYEVLPADDPEALGALPVPLADGRLVRGPRGTLIVSGSFGDLAPLGLRIVDPLAAHPLLLRLGAAEATPRTVLEDPQTRAAVSEAVPDIASAVLSLVDAAGLAPGELPWLGELMLPSEDGDLYAAGDLLLPGGALTGLLEPGHFGIVAPSLVETYGSRVLVAAGVLDGFAVANDADVLLDHDDCDHDLDGEDEWLDAVLDLLPPADLPPVVPEFAAVRDLELVADWPAALALLTRPPLRAALQPLRVSSGGEVPSYTAWWLSNHPVLDGRTPRSLRLPGADPLLTGLYGDAPGGLDDAALAMIGVRTTLADLLASHGGPEELLELMADASITLDRAQLRALWIALAGVDPSRVAPPSRVRAVSAGAIVVAPADDAVVVEAPDLLQLVADRALVLAPFDLAESLSELLDLPLAGEIAPGEVTSSGVVQSVPGEVKSLLPAAPDSYVLHEKLLVDGVPCMWRYDDGTVHCTDTEGLARGLAWATGQWGDRLAVAALLRDPTAVPLLLAEMDLS